MERAAQEDFQQHTTPPIKSIRLGLPFTTAILSLFIWFAPLTAIAPAIKLSAPRLNEFVLDHSGTDTHEYLEISGAPGTDYSNYSLLQIEGDASRGTIDGVYPIGITDANGLWRSAFLSGELENGSLTLLLVEGFSGTIGLDLDTDDDGALNITPWISLIDGVGVNDGDPGDLTYAAIELGPGFDGLAAHPGGASYFSLGSTSGWMRNDPDGAGLPGFSSTSPRPGEAYNTPGIMNKAVPLINEFVFNHTGTDTHEFVEVYGSSGSDYSEISLIVLEGDASANPGQVDVSIPLTNAGETGYWFTGYRGGDFENGTLSLLLVEASTAAAGTDLDTDDDGTLDTTPWTTLLDELSVSDGDLGDRTYGTPVFTPGFGGASRIPNANSLRLTSAWRRNDFDGIGLPGFTTGTPDEGEAYNTPLETNRAVGAQNTPALLIAKSAQVLISPGDTFTYTLAVQNETGKDLVNISITDVLPEGTNFAFSLDGGVLDGNTVTWHLPELPSEGSGQVSFAAKAPITPGLITNTHYAVTAGNFITPTFGAPLQSVVGQQIHIHHIQGPGESSPFAGRAVTGVSGIVTGVTDQGFFMQDPSPDENPFTSEGIFVETAVEPGVNMGEGAVVDGIVSEASTHTSIQSSAVTTYTAVVSIAPTPLDMPVSVSLEPFEGMLVSFPERLTASQNYFLGRYGQITLSAGGRLYQPTNGNGLEDTPEYNARRTIYLDDNTSAENVIPIPYLEAEDTLRLGDVVEGLSGVIDFGPIDSSGGTFYRLQPIGMVSFTRTNVRTAQPDPVHAGLTVASFNVLNYFNGDGQGGGFPTSRGADTYQEFLRQRTKIISAMLAIDADVFGLIEIENDGDGPLSALQDLVHGLNAQAGEGTYTAIPDPVFIGTDAIKVALIYKPARIQPIGVPRSSLDPIFSRPPVGQLFQETASGEAFNVIVNHFKSKGNCPADPLDLNADQGDGQGCWNAVRIEQAQAVLGFAEGLRLESEDPDVLLIGDLNSYGEEDPILILESGGQVNQISKFISPENRYTYVFDSMAGYLDHVLANAHLNLQVQTVTIWHINADEPAVIDYNTEFKSQDLYTPGPYRSSDHDPIIIGLELHAVPARIFLPFVFHAQTGK